MKTLKLTLKQHSGLLSALQSDTIYGHFCWRMLEQFGEKTLQQFIAQYAQGNPVFLLSNGFMQEGEKLYFPKPLVVTRAKVTDNASKTERIRNFVVQKGLKDNKFYSLNELNEFLSGNPQVPPDTDEEQQASSTQKKKPPLVQPALRTSVQIDRQSLSSATGKLFNYQPEYTSKDADRVIFIRVLNDDLYSSFNCESVLRDVFLTGFGKKKSSGYGHFDVTSIDEYNLFTEPEESNAFLVLGNYLPAPDEKTQPLAYAYSVKYGKLGEQLSLGANPFKNPIVMFSPGSCFTKNNNLPVAGRITKHGEISETFPNAVQFGMPFILRFNIPD